MKRETTLIIPLALIIAIVPFAVGQDLQGHRDPVPDGVLGSQLIVWSQVQKPQPLQQVSPHPAAAQAQPDKHRATTPSQATEPPHAVQTSTHPSAQDKAR